MIRKINLLVLLTMTIMSFGVHAGKVDEIAVKNVDNWNYALKSGHLDAIMRFYTQNAVLVEANGNVYGGTDKIREFWKGIVVNPGAYEFNLKEAHRDGDSIVLTAKLDSVVSGNNSNNSYLDRAYKGTIQYVIKEQGKGNWKTIVQQWN